MKFTVKPVFVSWLILLRQVPRQLFFTVWCGGFFGGFAQMLGVLPNSIPGIYTGRLPFPFFACAAIAFFWVPISAYIRTKRGYSCTEYRFFSDRLEFEGGFPTVNKRVIKLQDMKEVALRKGVLQSKCGLGSIYLTTGPDNRSDNGISFGLSNALGAGMFVLDVSEPDMTYEQIRKLVDAATV